MNKKGFTLVELLAIVVILAVIMVVAAPNMTKQIKKSEEESQNILNQKIENASKLYAAKYYVTDIVKCTSTDKENPCVKFNLYDLEQDGLINLKDNCSKKDENEKEILKNANSSYSINIYMKNNAIFYDYDSISGADMDCYKDTTTGN